MSEDIPTLRAYVLQTRRAFNNQNGKVPAAYRSVVNPCPFCTDSHSWEGLHDRTLAYLSCGPTVYITSDPDLPPPGREGISRPRPETPFSTSRRSRRPRGRPPFQGRA